MRIDTEEIAMSSGGRAGVTSAGMAVIAAAAVTVGFIAAGDSIPGTSASVASVGGVADVPPTVFRAPVLTADGTPTIERSDAALTALAVLGAIRPDSPILGSDASRRVAVPW